MTSATPTAQLDSDTDFGQLYAAFCARDRTYDGHMVAGVTSTGIYCRFSCPARKPLAQNVRFYPDTASARAAGLRPCKRCDPDAVAALPVPLWLAQLRAEVRNAPEGSWNEAALRARGLDPHTVRRAFQRHWGTSFIAFARATRLARAATGLTKGDPVIHAQLDAAYESAAGFRAAFARQYCCAPRHAQGRPVLHAEYIDTALGEMLALADEEALFLVEFTDRAQMDRQLARVQTRHERIIISGSTSLHARLRAQLSDYFAGRLDRFDLPLTFTGTPFQRRVWEGLCTIPFGETRSYGALAADIDEARAVRALASANAANAFAVIVPCHRVIGADGTLNGYAGGVWRKRWLLRHEGAIA